MQLSSPSSQQHNVLITSLHGGSKPLPGTYLSKRPSPTQPTMDPSSSNSNHMDRHARLEYLCKCFHKTMSNRYPFPLLPLRKREAVRHDPFQKKKKKKKTSINNPASKPPLSPYTTDWGPLGAGRGFPKQVFVKFWQPRMREGRRILVEKKMSTE